MESYKSRIDRRIAVRIHELRKTRKLTLEALARRSAVSRSMISLIERGETSPTAALLERLAVALGVPLALLFDRPPAAGAAREPIARMRDQPQWRDPESGYVRRNVSPPGLASPVRIVEVTFPAGAQVAFDTGSRDIRQYQQIWILEGSIEVTVGTARHTLRRGDCLAFLLDRPTRFRNRSRQASRYAVVIASLPGMVS